MRKSRDSILISPKQFLGKTSANNNYFKSWMIGMLALLLMSVNLSSFAQTTVTIGTGTTLSTAGTNGDPIYRSSTTSAFHHSKSIHLLTASQLSTAGVGSGSLITQWGYYKGTVGTPAGTNSWTLNVYLKNSSATALASGTAWNTMISGATLGYTATITSANMSAVAGAYWLWPISGFTYTGGAVECYVEWVPIVSASPFTTATFTWQYTTTATVQDMGTSNSTALPGTTTAYTTNLRHYNTRLTYTAGTPCSGTPAPGNTIASSNPVCSGVSFNLSLQNSTSGSGVTYQWQSADDNLFTVNLANLGTGTTQATTQTAAKYYRCQVTCSGNTGTSNPLLVTMNSVINCYCQPSYVTGTGSGDYCSLVQIPTTTLNNATGASASPYYTLYPQSGSTTATLTTGTSYTINLSCGTYTSNDIAVWIDYNQNGVLDNTSPYIEKIGETDGLGAGPATTSFTFTVPSGLTAGTYRLRVREADQTTTGLMEPCNTLNVTAYGETEDYNITIAASSPCTGTPAPGNTIASANPVCSGVNFNLSLQNATTGTGVTYQWQSADDAGFTVNLANLGTASTQTTSLTSSKYYRCQVTCSGNTGTSNSLLVNLNSNTCTCISYCTPVYSNWDGSDYVSNVALNGWSNAHGAPTSIATSYTNLTGLTTTTLTAGSPYTVTVTSGSYASDNFAVFIDFNNNGLFTDAGEQVGGPTTAPGSLTAVNYPFTVPAGATIGSHRLRVVCTTVATPIPCNTTGYGETEDYCITIAAASPCSGTPAPGNTLSSSNPACSGANITLSLQNLTPGSGVTYQWQSADDAAFTVNLTNLGTASTQVTSQTSAKYYRCQVTCSGNTGTSNGLLVTMQTDPTACYCGGVLGTYSNIGCNFGLGIEDVTVAGINNIANGCGGPLPTVYTNYTYLSGNVQQGLSYPITLGRGTFVNNACVFGVWVDWNNNNSFYDAGEFMTISLTGGAGVGQASNTGTLVVPAGATLGSHVMRIRNNYSVAPGSTTACGASLYTYGETEDYILNVVSQCSGNPVAGNTASFSSLACPNVPFTLYLQGVGAALGLTYQWQTSPDNIAPYTDITGATNPTRSQTQSTSAYYRCMVTCSNGGGSSSSTPLQMNMNTYANCVCVLPTYSGNGTGGCTGTTANNYIGQFTFAGISNTTTCGATGSAYQYFPSQIATVNQTVTYPVTISAPAAGAAFQRFKVYIDFNDNASCDDPGEMVYNSGPISTSLNSSSGFISIAANAPLGTHKLRVRSTNPLSSNQDANSCSDDGYYGEVEEYQITISGPPPCTGTPAPGQTLASTPLACASTTISLGLQFATSGAGVTYQWQSSLNAGFTSPVNLGTATTQTATQTATTWYRCVVTCSGVDGISTPVQVSYSVPCYCTSPAHGSDGCSLGLYINNFTFAGINNTSGCYSNVPYTTPFYSYFPGSVASVTGGTSYPYSITTPVNAGGYTQFFGIWIDFNNNGSFDDAGELIASTNPTTSTSTNSFTGSYTIPLSAPSGLHKMRIRSGNAAPVNSCSAANSGETEDYLIDIACQATASSNSPACVGGTLNLLSAYIGSGTPVSYSWTTTAANGFTSGIQNPSINPVTVNDAGIYTVTITDNTGCVASKTTTVGVSPAPDLSTSGGGEVCAGTGVTLSVTNNGAGQSSGNTYSWTTDAITPFTSTQQTPTITSSSTPANSGNYTVVVTNSFLCTASAVEIVAVNTNPILSVSSQSIESCPGAADATLNISATNGLPAYDFTYDFVNFNQDGIFTGLAAGPYTVYVSDANGCTGTLGATIISPNLPPTISCPGNQTSNAEGGVCSAIVTYSSSSTGIPAPAMTYAFTGSTTASGNGDGSGSAFNVGTTTVTLTVTNSCGTDVCTFDVEITDNQNPVITCPSNISVCDPGSPVVNFSVTATDNCSIASIVSTPPSGSTFPVGTTTVNSVATDVNGNTSTCSFTVTVSTPSTAPTSATTDAPNDNICVGNSVNLTVNGGSIGTGANWNWYSGSCGGTSVGTGATVNVSPTVTTTYFVRAVGACNTTACVSVTVVVSTAPVTNHTIMPFTGMPANLCNGTTATLSVAPVLKATFYVWDAPTGSYFNGNPLNVSPYTTATPSVTITFGNPGGSMYQIGVQAGNACGSSVRQSQGVRGIVSVPAAVSGPLTACANSSISYTTGAVTGATSYLWTVTGDATVSGTGTTASVTFGPAWNGGTLCVAAQTTCYTSPTKCITISKSAASLGAISGTFTACPNSTLTYSVPASAGAASYTWTLPSGSSGSSTTNSINVTFGPGYNAVGSICVSVTSICGVTSVVKCKTVAPGLPLQPASISGLTSGLCGQTIAYSCPSQGGGTTYNWTSPGTINSGQGSTSISTTFASLTTGNVCVTASNSCGSSAARCVAVKGAPNTPGAITATPSSWCANTAGVEFSTTTSSLTGIYTLSWAYPPAAVVTYAFGGGNSTSLILDWKTGSGNVNVTASNSCGSSTKTSTWSSTCREGSVASVNSLVVSPNPTTGILNINYTATKGNTVINVLDLTGRVVMTQTNNSVEGSNSTQLDMSKLAKGAYMLSVQSTQGNKQVRVVVE